MKSIEKAREEKNMINFGSVPYEAYVHAICNNISDFYKKARELLMLHKAFMTANEIYEIYVPVEIRDLAINFEASKITTGDVVRIMKGLVDILKQDTNKAILESMYAEVPARYFRTAEELETASRQESVVEPKVVSVTEAGDGKSMIVEFEDGSAILGVKDDINNIRIHEINGDLQGIYRQHGMTEKIYYVIQNKEGNFFKIDNMSGGYPSFINDFECCEKYCSKEFANSFLNEKYTTEMFPKEFDGAKVRKVVMTLQ